MPISAVRHTPASLRTFACRVSAFVRACAGTFLAVFILSSLPISATAHTEVSPPSGVGLASALLNSFPGDTPVHAKGEDGQPTLKAIADLRIGDEVLAWAEWKDGKEAYSYEQVTDTVASHKTQRLVHLTLGNGERITATEGHPFHTPEGWRDAILLKKGGQLLLKGGEGEGDSVSVPVRRTVLIEEVSTETKVIPVFNLEVANSHTFFVGEEGALAHNAGYSFGQLRAAVATAYANLGVKSLPKGALGKWGSPQRGNSKLGCRLDPPHSRSPGDPEGKPHINWWNYTQGKRGNGGQSGAVPID